MQALTFVEPGRLDWLEVAAPAPEPTDVIVRPLAVARCDLDPLMVSAGIFPGPYPVGHEFVAEIDQIGESVQQWAVGDRVLVPFQVSCGQCAPCRSHHFAACAPHRAPAGSAFGFGVQGGGHGGAMADLVRVPHADHMLVRSPMDIPLAALAALGDNVSDGYRTVAEPLALQPGADVLIIGGAGDSVGYYAVQWALVLGAGTVQYADTSENRCEIAASIGAEVEHVDGPWPRRLRRAPITVAFTIDPDALRTAIRSTEDYGHCTNSSVPLTPDVELPMLDMYTKGITFHTSRADARRCLPEVVDHVAARRFDPLATPTTIIDWSEAAEAWPVSGTKLVVLNH